MNNNLQFILGITHRECLQNMPLKKYQLVDVRKGLYPPPHPPCPHLTDPVSVDVLYGPFKTFKNEHILKCMETILNAWGTNAVCH